ncbi:MAG: hypothetical protein MK211_13340 [Flavobacteriales bacterium]|jgi:hypothetical protein|nr:hypothetical protein [Flavobacteriales bacterium]
MKKLFLIFNFLMLHQLAFSHETVNVTKDFNNVKVIFTTGYYYEEINKALIIGEYSERLSKKLNFQGKITLWFNHDYTNDKETYYLINSDIVKSSYSKDEIFIKMKDESYNILQVLTLLEQSILNFQRNDKLGEVLILKEDKRISNLLKSILEAKIYRPSFVKDLAIPDNGISYYFKQDSFYVYRIENEVENILFNEKSIYQLSAIDEYSILFFNSKTTFYFISSNRLRPPSKKIEIETNILPTKPYLLSNISKEMISLSFQEDQRNKAERVMIFNHKKGILIQDISYLFD